MTNPKHDIPRGILIGSVVAILVYLLIQLIAVAALPGIAVSKRPLAEAAAALMGTGGGILLSAGAICSTIGTLTALLLVGPRILFAMSLEGHMPAVLSHVHERFRSPDFALILFLAASAILTVLSDFTNLATLSAMARLVTYIGAACSLLVLRRKEPASKGFKAPGGPLLPILTVLISLYLLSAATREQLISGTVALVVGLLLYGFMRLNPFPQRPQP